MVVKIVNHLFTHSDENLTQLELVSEGDDNFRRRQQTKKREILAYVLLSAGLQDFGSLLLGVAPDKSAISKDRDSPAGKKRTGTRKSIMSK